MLDTNDTDAKEISKKRRLVSGIFVVVIGLLILYLANGVRQELHALTRAKSDVVQWNLSQAEVENEAFISALLRAMLSPETGLEEVRKRFDVFYSRIETIHHSELYAPIIAKDVVQLDLNEINKFIKQTALLMDQDDASLTQNLPTIAEQAEKIDDYVRRIALQGVEHFSQTHTAQRQSLYRILVGIAVLSGILLVVFLYLIRALERTNRESKHRAWLNDISRARMSAIVSTSLDAIVVTRTDSRIMEFNGAAEHIFGYQTNQIIGKSILSLIELPGKRQSDEMCMEAFLEACTNLADQRQRARVWGRKESGEAFPAELSIAPVDGAEGVVYVLYIRDISNEVYAENELMKARDSAIAGEKSKASLLAVMSHEMRTPLNGMLGTIELLDETELSRSQKEYLRIIRQSGALLLSHVNDVLDISRLDAGKLELDESQFALDTMIQDLLDGQKVLAQERGNTLVASFDSDGPIMVRSDQLRLRQILLNLISNANKFTEKGRIIVEVEPSYEERLVEIRVIDTGIGIAPSEISRIFDDFTTLDSTYGRQTGGTGLGLGIVRRVAQAMNGDVTAESVEGEGSMFTLLLPILAKEDAQPVAPTIIESLAATSVPPTSKALDKLRILVVEDNEINRIVVHDFLTLDDHQVSVAEDGTSGIAMAEKQKFDVILMDISMPDLDGTEVAQIIKSGDGLNRDTPIFALTAHAMQEDIERFKKAGMKQAIIKPITRKVLRDALFDLVCNQTKPGKKRPLLDHEVLDEFCEELGYERFQNFYVKFKGEMTDGVFALPGDGFEDRAKRAHKMAGSASMFGAMRLCCALNRLEKAAKDQNIQDTETYTELVSDVWHDTEMTFDQYLSHSPAAEAAPA